MGTSVRMIERHYGAPDGAHAGIAVHTKWQPLQDFQFQLNGYLLLKLTRFPQFGQPR